MVSLNLKASSSFANVKDGSLHVGSIFYHHGVDRTAVEDLVKCKGCKSMQRFNYGLAVLARRHDWDIVSNSKVEQRWSARSKKI